MNNPNEQTEAASNAAQDALHKKVIGEASDARAGVRISQQDYDDAKKVYDWFMDESNVDNINDAMSLLISTYESGSIKVSDYEKALSEGYDDLMDALEATGVGKNDDIESFEKKGMQLIHALVYYASKNKKWASSNYDSSLKRRMDAAAENIILRDGVVSAENTPMITQAMSVTPIHDGSVQLAQSDPRDTAIFAKEGGPFDTLFNGIFDKINALYDMEERNYATTSNVSNRFGDTIGGDTFAPVSMRSARSLYNYMGGTSNRFGDTIGGDTLPIDPDVISRRFKPIVWDDNSSGRIMPNEAAMDEKFMAYQPPMERLYQGVDGVLGRERSTSSQGSQQPMKVEISGRLELTSGGQSVDIMQEIQNNPLLVRRLTEMIITQMNNNRNGGKSEMFGGGRYAG